MSKKKMNRDGIIFSTDPDFSLEGDTRYNQQTLPASEQKLRLKLDSRKRAGKVVTLVEGFIGTSNDLEELGKKLKTFCGTGGSVKEGEIIIQGDQRDKLIQWLEKNGYKNNKKL